MSEAVKMKTKAASKTSVLRGCEILGLSTKENGDTINVAIEGGSYGNMSFTKKGDLFEATFDGMYEKSATRLLSAINIAETQAIMESLGYAMVNVEGLDIASQLRQNKTIELTYA